MNKKNAVLDKSFDLALQVIAYVEILECNKKYVIAKQILRAGTSIGANIREAQSGESKADFIHKLKIADKEAHELDYWFDLCGNAPNYPSPPEEIRNILLEIEKLLSKIIATSKRG